MFKFGNEVIVQNQFCCRLSVIIILMAFSLRSQGKVDLPENLADPSSNVEAFHTGRGYCEGPAVDSLGNLFYSEFSSPKRKIWKVSPDGKAAVFLEGDKLNGMEFDPQGRLVMCEKDKIIRLKPDGTVEVICRTGDNGMILAETNDLSIASSGAMFFTNHGSGHKLFYRSPEGILKQFGDYDQPNGVEWLEEKKFIYLCDSGKDKVEKWNVSDDGVISKSVLFVEMGAPDGLTVDEHYNVYIASWKDGKIYVFDSTGKKLGSISLDKDSNPNGNTSNCCFGGSDYKTLYITGDGGAYKVRLKVKGRKRHSSSLVKFNGGSIRIDNISKSQNKSRKAIFNLLGRGMNCQSGNNSGKLTGGVYIVWTGRDQCLKTDFLK